MTGLWHLIPKPPKIMMSYLSGIWRRNRNNLIPSWVKPLGEPFNIAPLAACIPSLIGKYNRNLALVYFISQFAYALLLFLDYLFIVFPFK